MLGLGSCFARLDHRCTAITDKLRASFGSQLALDAWPGRAVIGHERAAGGALAVHGCIARGKGALAARQREPELDAAAVYPLLRDIMRAVRVELRKPFV